MVTIKGKIGDVKKGDKIKVDGTEYEVDAHYVLIEHSSNNEMTIECFDPKAKEDDGDYQIRYFDDRVEDSIAFFKLDGIMYQEVDDVKKYEF